MTGEPAEQQLRGVAAATIAYLIWGLLPIFWRLLEQVMPYQILAHRVLWSSLLTGGILLCWKRGTHFRQLFASRRRVLLSTASGMLLGVNWLIYIWAVNNAHIIEASLGYYINPLVTVGLAVCILKERLRFGQVAALLVAVMGVAYLTFIYGRFPWIALSLAASFGVYGLIHKTHRVQPLDGLFLETLSCLLPAVVILGIAESQHQGAFVHAGTVVSVLLVVTGIVTTVPLLCFAYAAQNIPLSLLGILQYTAPTINLLLGVFLYHEEFPWSRVAGFLIVWGALLIFLIEGALHRARVRRAIIGS